MLKLFKITKALVSTRDDVDKGAQSVPDSPWEKRAGLYHTINIYRAFMKKIKMLYFSMRWKQKVSQFYEWIERTRRKRKRGWKSGKKKKEEERKVKKGKFDQGVDLGCKRCGSCAALAFFHLLKLFFLLFSYYDNLKKNQLIYLYLSQ